MFFYNENVSISIKISLKFAPKGPIDNKLVGSGNGLAPNRRQAITLINADPVHRRTYAALGGDGSFFCTERSNIAEILPSLIWPVCRSVNHKTVDNQATQGARVSTMVLLSRYISVSALEGVIIVLWVTYIRWQCTCSSIGCDSGMHHW